MFYLWAIIQEVEQLYRKHFTEPIPGSTPDDSELIRQVQPLYKKSFHLANSKSLLHAYTIKNASNCSWYAVTATLNTAMTPKIPSRLHRRRRRPAAEAEIHDNGGLQGRAVAY